MRIGEKVTAADLLPVESNTATEIVVRQRDAIRLIARQGQLEFVVPRAEAMQNGRVGQVIRVKNLQSNRIVNARLVSAEEAVVDLP
jgi:flagella basal body P-ring formation protein FlgA